MSKLIHDHRGGVTVFITLILIPSVLFVSIFLELAIFKASAPYNAMRLQGESELSNYNGLLKEAYGLLAMTHGEERYHVIGVGELMLNPTSPNGALLGYELTEQDFFNPMRNYSAFALSMALDDPEAYSLKNVNVLQTQISDYMRFRAAASFFSDIGSPTELIEQFEKLKDDSEAINSKAKLDKEIADLNKHYQKLYGYMVINDEFDKDVRSDAVDTLNDAAKVIAENAAKISELEAEVERLKAARAAHSCPSEEVDPNHTCPPYNSMINDCENEISDCEEAIDDAADSGRKSIKGVTDAMERYEKNINPNIKDVVAKIAAKLEKIAELKATHIKEVGEASDTLKGAFEDELAQYDAILMDPPDLTTVYTEVELNAETAKELYDKYDSLTCGGVSWDTLSSSNATAQESSYTLEYVGWKRYRDTHPQLLNKLAGWYGPAAESAPGKSEGKQANGKLEGDMGSQQDKLLPTDNPSPRGVASIPEQYHSYLYANTAAKTQGKMSSDGMDITEGLSDTVAKDTASGSMGEVTGLLDGVGELAMNGLHKVLLVEYQLGVFSHSTTGKDGSDEEKAEDSITGVPKSPRLNYMYGSELEYMYAGGKKAWQNQLAARGTMMGILFVRDFAVSYTVKDLNTEINTMGTAIAGGNPMIAIATKLALRGLVTGLESGDELATLLKGESINIMKTKDDWKYSLSGMLETVVDEAKDEIKDEIEEEVGVDTDTDIGDSKPKLELNINYEQFMRFLLLAMVDRETLLGRTQDLIMLNLDNYESDGAMYDEPANDTAQMLTAVKIEAHQKVGFLTQATKMLGLEGIDGEKYISSFFMSY